MEDDMEAGVGWASWRVRLRVSVCDMYTVLQETGPVPCRLCDMLRVAADFSKFRLPIALESSAAARILCHRDGIQRIPPAA